MKDESKYETHTAGGEATLNPLFGAKSIFELAVMSQKEIEKIT